MMIILSLVALAAVLATPTRPGPFPSAFSAFEALDLGSGHQYGAMISMSNGLVRTDGLASMAGDVASVTTSIATATNTSIITDYLNGTVSCVTIGGGNPFPIDLSTFKFVGTDMVRGVAAFKYFSKSGFGGAGAPSDPTNYWVAAADNTTPLKVSSKGVVAEFTHYLSNDPNPDVFDIAAGLKCTPVGQDALSKEAKGTMAAARTMIALSTGSK